jgi:bifunctional UDP-N-acetylglucosamine pyrophosphorylase / glucosamine-1-phosphate N-acetyltransferase
LEFAPDNLETVVRLMEKGVDIPNPMSLHIGRDVDINRISRNGVRIYPGCRIYGPDTVIAAGARLGREGPVTVEDCQIGPRVELKAGYFKKAVFLDQANMGSGAHVREGCILEEEANGAHCVGLKQAILFPFVTLGSLINFCDCLMAGGTSRKDHSEVGSSYIHFNFTPSGDKTTPSLMGDVPRGVMLNQPAIFLGGQGGMVGPLRLDYGNVVAAGAILRKDCLEQRKLIITKTYRSGIFPFVSDLYSGLPRIVENNILYLANLMALKEWYVHVRAPFFESQELGLLIYKGALDKLSLAIEERLKRLKVMAGKIEASLKQQDKASAGVAGKREFCNGMESLSQLFADQSAGKNEARARDGFLQAFMEHRQAGEGAYVATVQGLPTAVSEMGTKWLQDIVDGISLKATALMPSLSLFKKLGSVAS